MVKRAMLSIYDLTIVVLYVYQSGCLHEKNLGDQCNTRPGFDFDGAASTAKRILERLGIPTSSFFPDYY